eukprot:CAMPEP_0176013350 /NCGR_PEP_ID=MMETSP0120_2-20121206/6262_1 /TAXON_ID=160619 /ORGANISM="Kryptoperidinium foliaceum, Strain CCMP 1326" /LENGTH=176 /DNA_ID=CAMNT_0017346257 /DNA_START=692 /DNA_END=1222 /DNA_ORIENTATION=-
MQIIIPPLEDEDNETPKPGDMARNSGSADQRAGSYDEEQGNLNGSQSLMSDELRESFEAMKSVWRQAGRGDIEDSASTAELRRKEREQAVETALAIDAEVAKWRNGIAELEAMLAATEHEEDGEDYVSEREDAESWEEQGGGAAGPRPGRVPIPAVRFPPLPPVVVPDEDDASVQD